MAVSATMIRRSVAVVAAVLALATLTSCASPSTAGSTGQPAVGLCHLLTHPEQFDTESESAPAVPCTEIHTTETFATQPVPTRFDAAKNRPGSSARATIVAEACTALLLRKFLAASDRQALYGVFIYGFLPTTAAWAAGDRWVRCDAVVTRSEKVLTPVKRFDSMAGLMATPLSEDLTRCYLQPTKSDGLALRGSSVPCSAKHSSRAVNDGFVSYIGVTPANVTEGCTKAVLAFLGASPFSPDRVTAVVTDEGDGKQMVNCALAEASIGS